MEYANAVFEGGGVKSIALVGAAQEVEERGYVWHSLAGSSGGSIVAALLAAGYSADELYDLLVETQFNAFLKEESMMAKVPYIGAAIRFFSKNGLYTGDSIEAWLRQKLRDKGVKYFKDLQHNLKVTVSDITLGRLTVLPDDLPLYGLNPETFEVALAVRMSISLPFFFEPVFLVYGEDRQFSSCMMDGGLLSNFPVWLFDKESQLRWPTFGFKLISEAETLPHKTETNFDILKAIIATLIDAHDSRYIAEHDYVRTIVIPTLGVKTTEFSISQEKFLALHQSGRNSAVKFFARWNHDNYLRDYRSSLIHLDT